MKKFLSFFAIAALVFSGCSDDDDNAGNGGDNGSNELRRISVGTADIKNLPSSVDIDEVGFTVYYGTNQDREHELVTSRWNGGFSMVLPETVSSTYLSSITSLLPDDYSTTDISVSASAMVTAETYFKLYNDDDYLGYIYVADGSGDSSWKIMYIYSDRNVKVKGKMDRDYDEDDNDNPYDEEWEYDLDMKKGWNRVAVKWTRSNGVEKHHWTTDLPKDLKWYVDLD